MNKTYDIDLLLVFLDQYKNLTGDGYVELMLSFIKPMISKDEWSRRYALELLLLLTGRSEFKRALILEQRQEVNQAVIS